MGLIIGLNQTLKAPRGFLGLSGYYQRFAKNYGIITKPLLDLLRKDNFFWFDTAESDFLDLKQWLMTVPVLVLPNF